ncbi:MAG: hypothetical protein HY917_02020 [Candidatus Diapherotrites archaeon]|nr:hypothetical protein [Candidatus Diapherotrites archaeon]
MAVRRPYPQNRAPRRSPEQIKHGIRSVLQLDVDPLPANHHPHPQLASLYEAAKGMKREGKSFMGHGTLERLLEHEIGLVPINGDIKSAEHAKNLIRLAIQKGVPLHAIHWQKSNHPLPWLSTAKGLYALYNYAHDHRFFGHKDWTTLLHQEFGVPFEAVQRTQARIAKRYPEQINREVQELIESGVPLHAGYWFISKQAKEPSLDPITRKRMQQLFVSLQASNFLGHGSWYEYLRREQGLNALNPENMPSERLQANINLALQRIIGYSKASLSANQWNQGFRKKTTRFSLASIYKMVRNRKMNGKMFMGHGTWARCLENEPELKNNSYRIHLKIREMLAAKKIKPEEAEWTKNKTPVNPSGTETPADLVFLAQSKTVEGVPFFGYGSFQEYLNAFHQKEPSKQGILARSIEEEHRTPLEYLVDRFQTGNAEEKNRLRGRILQRSTAAIAYLNQKIQQREQPFREPLQQFASIGDPLPHPYTLPELVRKIFSPQRLVLTGSELERINANPPQAASFIIQKLGQMNEFQTSFLLRRLPASQEWRNPIIAFIRMCREEKEELGHLMQLYEQKARYGHYIETARKPGQ